MRYYAISGDIWRYLAILVFAYKMASYSLILLKKRVARQGVMYFFIAKGGRRGKARKRNAPFSADLISERLSEGRLFVGMLISGQYADSAGRTWPLGPDLLAGARYFAMFCDSVRYYDSRSFESNGQGRATKRVSKLN